MAVNRNCFNFVIHIHAGAVPILENVPGCSGNRLNFFDSPHIVLPAYSWAGKTSSSKRIILEDTDKCNCYSGLYFILFLLFLVDFFTSACPHIFNLIEKDVLSFSKTEIVFIGNLLIVGALAGFVLGGRMVDKLGTKYVFMFCHFGFGAILILFLLRSLFPVKIIVFLGILTLLFGLVQALSLIHIWRCRRYSLCRSRWSPYH